MGSAVLGIAAVTGESPLETAKRFCSYSDVIRPDPERRAVYDQKYQTYKFLRALYLGQLRERV